MVGDALNSHLLSFLYATLPCLSQARSLIHASTGIRTQIRDYLDNEKAEHEDYPNIMTWLGGVSSPARLILKQ